MNAIAKNVRAVVVAAVRGATVTGFGFVVPVGI